MLCYIDERGEVLAASELKAHLRSGLNAKQLGAYAVLNLGYVALEEQATKLHVRLRPRAVSSVTLAALLYWLGDRGQDRTVVSHFESAWHHEVVGRASLLQRIADLVIDPRALRQGEFYRKRLQGADGALGWLVSSWRREAAAPFSERYREILNNGLAGRYMLIRRPQWSRRLEICDVGRGFLVYDDDWLANAIGRRFEDQPDHLYGRWAAEAYYEASSTGQAVVDDVDALIDRPKQGKARVQYRRIILPLTTGNGDQLLLCASLLDNSIVLRPSAA
jgi:hypothetical protein